MAFNESIQDPIVNDSSQNSLEKYKFIIGADGLVYVRSRISGTLSFSGLSESIRITTMTVGDTATALPITSLANRNSISITNKSNADTIYLGSASVTADTVVGVTSGWEIPPLESFNVDITDDVIIYAIAETGKSITVKVLEMA